MREEPECFRYGCAVRPSDLCWLGECSHLHTCPHLSEGIGNLVGFKGMSEDEEHVDPKGEHQHLQREEGGGGEERNFQGGGRDGRAAPREGGTRQYCASAGRDGIHT